MNIDFKDIKKSKNLLAFSAGVDSTALFFMLVKDSIPFDIAIVDYNQRQQSKQEVAYAKKLAKSYNKQIFVKEVFLEESNFEKKARDVRYTFFEQIIKEHNYTNLITAHQLDDKLEWFMMQLTKGAGLFELIGLNEWEQRDNYKIFKPLLNVSKQELENYLNENKINYFVDKSNYDEKYRRNYFRHNITNLLIKNHKEGIKKSFEYLQSDLNSLKLDSNPILKIKELEVFKTSKDDNINIRVIDKNLKKRGFIISKATRDEIIKQKQLVISHEISISILLDYIWISPTNNISMDKKFKEKCRIKKIPKNIRGYLYKESINLDKINFSF
ncbi:MAG: tRNA lysidine(34) synthetase TilS [Campylobacterota bacterium]